MFHVTTETKTGPTGVFAQSHPLKVEQESAIISVKVMMVTNHDMASDCVPPPSPMIILVLCKPEFLTPRGLHSVSSDVAMSSTSIYHKRIAALD